MERIQYNKQEEEKKLAGFIFNMDEDEIGFIEQAQDEGYALNEEHTLDSVNELERYILDRGINFQDSSSEALHERTLCWYYLGEVVRMNYGGSWQFSMNDDNSMHWGHYVVEGHTSIKDLEFEPLGQVKRFSRRQNRGAFLRSINAQVNPEPINFSDLPDEPEFIE